MNFGLAQIDFQFDGFIHYGHYFMTIMVARQAVGGVSGRVAVALSVGALE